MAESGQETQHVIHHGVSPVLSALDKAFWFIR